MTGTKRRPRGRPEERKSYVALPDDVAVIEEPRGSRDELQKAVDLLGPYEVPSHGQSVEAYLHHVAKLYLRHRAAEKASPRRAELKNQLPVIAEAAASLADAIERLPPWMPKPVSVLFETFEQVDRLGCAAVRGDSAPRSPERARRFGLALDDDPLDARVSTAALARWLRLLAQDADRTAKAVKDGGASNAAVVPRTFGTAKGQLAHHLATFMYYSWADVQRDRAAARERFLPTTAPKGRLVELMEHVHSYATGKKTAAGMKSYAEDVARWLREIRERDEEMRKLEDRQLSAEEVERYTKLQNENTTTWDRIKHR